MNLKNNIVLYQNGEIELKITINNETIWLRQNEISLLFGKDRSVITRHINNILKDKEVDEKSNVQKMHIPNSDKKWFAFSKMEFSAIEMIGNLKNGKSL
jgi:hypothetical protein